MAQEHHEIYREILRQAAAEAVRADDEADIPGVAGDAERLADVLYRLCVEFGLAFNGFRAEVLEAALETTKTRARTESSDAEPAAAYLEPIADELPLLIFALELMPEDSDL